MGKSSFEKETQENFMYHGINAGSRPYEETRIYTSSIFKDARWTNKNTGTDDGAHDNSNTVEKRHFRLQLDLVIALLGGRDRVVGPLLAIFDAS